MAEMHFITGALVVRLTPLDVRFLARFSPTNDRPSLVRTGFTAEFIWCYYFSSRVHFFLNVRRLMCVCVQCNCLSRARALKLATRCVLAAYAPCLYWYVIVHFCVAGGFVYDDLLLLLFNSRFRLLCALYWNHFFPCSASKLHTHTDTQVYLLALCTVFRLMICVFFFLVIFSLFHLFYQIYAHRYNAHTLTQNCTLNKCLRSGYIEGEKKDEKKTEIKLC